MSAAAIPSTAAPSVATAEAAPAKTAAPASPAPAAAAAEPTTMNEIVERALKSMTGEPSATPANAAPEAGQEPSPAAGEPSPANPSSDQVESPAETEGDEPTVDEMANWTDGEKRLHGALVKERNESKEARQQLRELKAEMAELQTKLNAKPAPQAEPETPAAQNPSVPRTEGMLADCNTFEAVDALCANAAIHEVKALRMQNLLNRNEIDSVVEQLKAEGVKAINGIPTDQATANQIGDYLADVYENTKLIQAHAPQRKQWIESNQGSMTEAVKIIPALSDAKSAEFKAAVQIVTQNPWVRQRPDWPVLVAKQILGEQTLQSRTKPAAAIAKPQTPAASRPAPGAPTRTAAASPTPKRMDVLRAKMNDGTASMTEMQEYARMAIGT